MTLIRLAIRCWLPLALQTLGNQQGPESELAYDAVLEPAPIILRCAAYYKYSTATKARRVRSGKGHLGCLEKALGKIFNAVSTMYMAPFGEWSSHEWDIDREYPGYLRSTKWFIRVPVQLVPVFPDESALREVVRLANLIKTEESSIVFLSGSTALRRVLEFVDDIDFCEYLPLRGDPLCAALEQRASSNQDELLLVRLKLGEADMARPFPLPLDREQIDKFSSKDGSSLKLDYLWLHASKRPFEVSNIALLCDDDFQSAAFTKTFSFQEVQIGAIDCVPNPVNNVLELGRYVCWLVDQIRYYKNEKNYVKSLKRSLSLCRVCWLPKMTERIQDIFKRSTALIDLEIATSERLLNLINGSAYVPEPGTAVCRLQRHIDACKLERRNLEADETRAFPNGFEDAAVAIIQQVLKLVDDLSNGAIR